MCGRENFLQCAKAQSACVGSSQVSFDTIRLEVVGMRPWLHSSDAQVFRHALTWASRGLFVSF